MQGDAQLAELLGLIGDAATLRLLELYGGTRIYVPAGARAANHLARELGETPAAVMAAAFGRTWVRVPLAKAWRAQLYRAQGLSYAAIARKLGCNDTTVWKYLHGDRASAQLALPLP